MSESCAAPVVIEFVSRPPVFSEGSSTWFVRSRSFLIGWTLGESRARLAERTAAEYLLLLPDVGAEITVTGCTTFAPSRSVVVIPGGDSEVALTGPGRAIRLFAPVPDSRASIPIELDENGPPLRSLDPRFVNRSANRAPAVHILDTLPNSVGMPRAKLFQSATLSINWVEYVGPRDRSQLSPHHHEDFEQASLAIEGSFVHHLRTPWVKDARAWRDDLHQTCGPGSVALIPPGIQHTTEGIGVGRHILIDIFAPPRRDFAAKGQILNGSDYRDAAERAP